MSSKKRKLDQIGTDDKTNNPHHNIINQCKDLLRNLNQHPFSMDTQNLEKHQFNVIVDLQEHLTNWILEYHKTKRDDERPAEFKYYPRYETIPDTCRRAKQKEEWTVVSQDDFDDVFSDDDYAKKCLRHNDCWYDSNSDQVRSCFIYRLKGTKTIFLCDMCRDNELENFAVQLNGIL